MITVSEVMAKEVVTINASDDVQQAREVMSRLDIRHLPVTDNDNKPVGIITQRDILKSCTSSLLDDKKVDESTIAVSMIMSNKVLAVHPEDSLRSAGLQLQSHKYGCLPVVDNGEVVGIITDSDFVGVAINLIEQMDHLEENEY